MDNRGRFQAQGKTLEESENWSQIDELKYSDGKKLLDQLENKLSPKERQIRGIGFKKCRECILEASKNNGIRVVNKPFIKSFPKNARERVDLEVHKGVAFI